MILKGISWSGFQDPGTNCPEELGGFRYFRPLREYTNVLERHVISAVSLNPAARLRRSHLWRTKFVCGQFNAVRLPLYAQGVLDDPEINTNRCGHLSRDNLRGPVRRYMDALGIVIQELASKGQFVVLDVRERRSTRTLAAQPPFSCARWSLPLRTQMHSLDGRSNPPNWCGAASADACDTATEATLRRAWIKLASAFCAHQNVILADLFNEPYGATWGQWKSAAERLGNAVHRQCSRWLIGVQGVGRGEGECQSYAGTSCWWGENSTSTDDLAQCAAVALILLASSVP